MANEAPVTKPKPITITEVKYGMTVSLPQFENVKFEMVATVAPDEDWRDVLESLRRKSLKLKERIREEGS